MKETVMSNKPKDTVQPRVDVGADSKNNASLSARAKVVGEMATTTPLYQGNIVFKAAVDDFVVSGITLASSDTKVLNLEAALVQGRADRDVARTNCRDCHAVCVAQVEKNSPTGADLVKYGFAQLEVVKAGSVLPTAILWKLDHATGLMLLHVKFPGRARKCIVEISPDPIGPTTWHRLDGHGATRTVTGFPPGTYWAHAATSLSDGRSEWFGPVPLIIKAA
jgi:hypothetical protein